MSANKAQSRYTCWYQSMSLLRLLDDMTYSVSLDNELLFSLSLWHVTLTWSITFLIREYYIPRVLPPNLAIFSLSCCLQTDIFLTHNGIILELRKKMCYIFKVLKQKLQISCSIHPYENGNLVRLWFSWLSLVDWTLSIKLLFLLYCLV